MTIQSIEIGATYASGNTYRPADLKVLALLDWKDVPAKEQKTWQVICYWEILAESELKWVKYRSSQARGVLYTREDTFKGTSHASHDAMIESYVEGRKAIGLAP